MELAFPNYGKTNAGDDTIHKWTGSIRISIKGSPTAEDSERVREYIKLMDSVDGLPQITLDSTNSNLTIQFSSDSQLYTAIPGYTKDNWGYTYCYWANGVISEAQIGIATNVTNQKQRNHLIFEELSRSLGLLTGNTHYEDSIFYSTWTETQELSALDFSVLEILYNSKVEPNANYEAVAAAIGYSPEAS